MPRTIALILLLASSVLLLVSTADAQGTYSCSSFAALARSLKNPDCGYWWHWDDLPDVNMPDTAVCCNISNTFDGEICVAPGVKPGCRVPPHTANSICIECLLAGHPINLTTGNTFITESDVSVPGLGGGLQLSRKWNSMLPSEQNSYAFAFGQNWRSNFEERILTAVGDGYLRYARSDGGVWYFGVASVGPPNVFKVSAPATDTTTTLTKGAPSWTMSFQNGEKRLFDATSGMLTGIIDRNGNTLSLAYDSYGRLASVTDAVQRHLYFNYPSNSISLVSSVTSDVGVTLSFAYDTQGRLTQMTKADGTTVSFEYDGNSNITNVRDANGKVLESHTYDALHRGLTSTRANGVDAVTVTYPQ
jgi:YD repeat-containing protein